MKNTCIIVAMAIVVADKWFTSNSSDLSAMRQTQRAHSKSFTVCSVSGLFYFGQIQTNLVKTYQLVFGQQRPISGTEIGGVMQRFLAHNLTHYLTH